MFSASLRPLSITVHLQNYSVASFGRSSLSNNRYKTKRAPFGPRFLLVFPLLGRLFFVASPPFVFRLIA